MTVRKLLLPFGIALLALGLSACDTGRKAPPKTEVRVLNVVPRYASLGYRRVESSVSNLDFKVGDVFTYDEDTYKLHVETVDPLTGAPLRLLSFDQKVVAGTTYTVVIYDAGDTLDSVVLEAPPVAKTAPDIQVQAIHVAKDLPPVDFYLTPPGTDLLATAPLGTIGFLQQVAPRNLPAGVYEITVTAAGDPSNVLLKSSGFTLDAGRSISFSIAPEAGASNQPFTVVAFGDVSNPFINASAPASLRIINASADQAPRDVAIDSQFSPPQFPAVPFPTVTPYGNIPSGVDVQVNVTPAGNPGTLEVDTTQKFSPTSLYTMIVGGDPGALSYAMLLDDNRRFTQYGTLRFYSGATQIPSILFYLIPPGGDVELATPLASITAPGGGDQLPVPPGTYELWMKGLDPLVVVAGPIPITINAGGIYGVLATNNASGVSADVKLLDDFQ
jgi:hypothetical protein